VSRRAFLSTAPAVPFLVAAMTNRAAAQTSPPAATGTPAAAPVTTAGLQPMTGGAVPISSAERRARIAKAQTLLAGRRIGALLVDTGSSLDYFTGIRWNSSERTTAAVIPARGEVIIVTPAFEEPSVRETLAIPADVRVWNEDESPFLRIVQGLRDRGIRSGPVAVEPTMRYFIIDGVRNASKDYQIVSGAPVVRACRMIKSAAELALMQTANDITIAALRHLYAHVERGMSAADLAAIMNDATIALGGSPEFALSLLNEASAYPHGSHQPQSVAEGSVILMDCGCSVHGYQSDISRTWVFGEANARQRTLWNTVKRGQQIALESAKIGVAAGALDDAVRKYYATEGWGPGYKLPGLPHRTGHGIGLDGHEPAYLVHGDATPLETGMCFSDEPGLYVPGEFGIRLEDCWHMTDAGPKLFTGLAKSIDDPF
jgi:Xaa-Pro dipeptidase